MIESPVNRLYYSTKRQNRFLLSQLLEVLANIMLPDVAAQYNFTALVWIRLVNLLNSFNTTFKKSPACMIMPSAAPNRIKWIKHSASTLVVAGKHWSHSEIFTASLLSHSLITAKHMEAIICMQIWSGRIICRVKCSMISSRSILRPILSFAGLDAG